MDVMTYLRNEWDRAGAWLCVLAGAIALIVGYFGVSGTLETGTVALDGDNKDLPEKERLAVAFARKLTDAPATVTDADVEGLRKVFEDKLVAEIVHHVCNAAFLNRVTEAAKLPLDK